MILRRNDCGTWLGGLLLLSALAGCASASGAATPTTTGGTTAAGVGGTATGSSNQSGTGGDTSNPTSSSGDGGASSANGGTSSAGGVANPTGGAKATGGLAATGGAVCSPGTQIGSTNSTNYFMASYSQLAPFYIFNNGWSSSSTNLTTAGTQESVSVFDTCTPGTISWSTDYNWSGANNTVKAFPAAILGWHSTKGWKVTSQTMLPKTVSSIASATCSWSYSVTGGASQDVSYDIWVHNTSCDKTSIATNTAPSDEVMIWLYSNGGVQPAGNQSQTGLSISGATWNLWEGTVGTWQCHSFVRQGNSTTVNDLDIKAFLDKLSLGSKCLSSIEAGTEVFQGSGTVKTSSYTCNVQ